MAVATAGVVSAAAPGTRMFPPRTDPRGVPHAFGSDPSAAALRTVRHATIRGGHRVWPVGVRFPRFAPVEVIYHPLFNVDQESAEESRALAKHETESLQAIIGGALNRDIDS